MRIARHDDVEVVAAFTTGTFDWGDYVPQLIDEWIDDPSGAVMVETDGADVPIAVGRCVLLTPREAWLHAARVHPDHRGAGIAGNMAVALTDWARDQGAIVARLLIEEANTSSIRHINKTAFTKKTVVHRGFRSLAAPEPHMNGNGGIRRRSPLVARRGKGTDAELVAATWTSGEAGRKLRGLIARSWSFHRLRTEDVEAAAKRSMLWEIGASWAITDEHDGTFEVVMLEVSPPDAADVVRSLVDVANDRGAERFSAWVADCDWLVGALVAAGCETEPSGLYAQAL